jgi:hypothetical protein
MSNDIFYSCVLHKHDYPGTYREIDLMLCEAIELKRKNDFPLDVPGAIELRKGAGEFLDYQKPDTYVERDSSSDRVFPLDTVTIRSKQEKHGINAGEAVLHMGPYADEVARMMCALAVTIGRDIYFRNGAYRPESEEGQAVLAHELTHVGQYTDKRVHRRADIEELEEEAEGKEAREIYNEDPVVDIQFEGELFRMRKSEIKKVERECIQKLERWVMEQKTLLDGEEYLRLLTAIAG